MKLLNRKLQKAVNDNRYHIAMEFCGHKDRRYVTRFADQFLGSYVVPEGAIMAAIVHQGERIEVL